MKKILSLLLIAALTALLLTSCFGDGGTNTPMSPSSDGSYTKLVTDENINLTAVRDAIYALTGKGH